MTTQATGGEEGLLESGCRELGVELTAAQRECLIRYLDLLYVWNKAAGLTTIRRPDAVRLHLLDSLAALGAVAAGEGGPCLDLGTGAGLPGMVLAIALPGVQFVLAESNRRRCSFLLEVVRVLRVPNVRVVEGDVDTLPRDPAFPLVISRAFRQPPEFLRIARGFVETGGRVVLLMADPTFAALEALETGADLKLLDCRRLHLPAGNEPRAIVTFQRA
ncbi:MAG: 16S rRNA (guanine(527)-N(7))-methyltransferase RsmG [Candidatus Binatia bacterium]